MTTKKDEVESVKFMHWFIWAEKYFSDFPITGARWQVTVIGLCRFGEDIDKHILCNALTEKTKTENSYLFTSACVSDATVKPKC